MATDPTAPTLTDGVVTIRGHRPEDAQRVWEQCQDPLVQGWTTVPVPYPMDYAVGFVEREIPAGWANNHEWAYALDVDGAYGGTLSLRNEGNGRAEIAYAAHPAVRGTGAVERGLRLLVEWGFAAQGLRTIIWWADRGNWASRRTAWRLGFSVEGTTRQWLTHRGELRDAWVGTLLREDPREPRTTWLDCPVLEVSGTDPGTGLRLRPVVTADIERVVEACAEPRTQRWLGQLPAPYTHQDAADYVESRTEQRATAQGVTWAVTEPGLHSDELLATVSWFNWRPGVECEIGYWTHPDARGRGLMTRVVSALTDHVFETLDLRRVAIFAAVDNDASCHVAEACGFTRYGVERFGAHVRDGWVDMALYDVTAAEWRAREAASTSTANPASDSTAPTSSGDR